MLIIKWKMIRYLILVKRNNRIVMIKIIIIITIRIIIRRKINKN